jgi:hypothetical protein
VQIEVTTNTIYATLFYILLAVPGMRCNAIRKPPSRSTSHEVR